MKGSTIKWAGVALASLGAVAMSSVALAQSDQSRVKFPRKSSEGLPEFRDGIHSLGFDGLAQFDWTHFAVNSRMRKGFGSGAAAGALGTTQGTNRNDQLVYENGFATGVKLRRFSINLRGALGNDFQFRAGLGFEPYHDTDLGTAGSSGNGRFRVRLYPTFVNYSGFNHFYNTDISVGQIAPFAGLDNTTSSIDTLFLERALASDAFSSDFGLGAAAHGHWEQTVTGHVSVFTHNADSNEGNKAIVAHAENRAPQATGIADRTKQNDRWAILARFTYSPVHNSDTTYHLGAHGWYQGLIQNLNSASDLAYYPGISPIPEACGRQTSALISTGAFTAKSFQQWGLEGAAAWGSYSIRGELFHRRFKRSSVVTGAVAGNPGGAPLVPVVSRAQGDPKFYGGHLEGSWVITGEKRPYDAKYGVFRNPTPNSRCGAWEVAVRYSFLKLEDKKAGFDGMNGDDLTNAAGIDRAVRRAFLAAAANGNAAGRARVGYYLHGKQNNITVGLNWFAHHHVRVSGNYVHARAKYADRHRPKEIANIWALRAQFSW